LRELGCQGWKKKDSELNRLAVPRSLGKNFQHLDGRRYLIGEAKRSPSNNDSEVITPPNTLTLL
jgi:hypothetical protein